mgnify:CR=1 FL=1
MMKLIRNNFKNYFIIQIDGVILGLVLWSYWISQFFYQPTFDLFGIKNPLIVSCLIVLLAFLNLVLYRWVLSKISESYQWKDWHLLTYASDMAFWIILISWLNNTEITIVDLFKFGLVFLVLITFLLVVYIRLIKFYFEQYPIDKQLEISSFPAPIHLGFQYQHNTVLITGAAGSIGSELTIQLAAISKGTILLLDQSETELHQLVQSIPKSNARIIPILGDIRSRLQIQQLFEAYKPNLIFHAAAYKQLPILEQFPKQAVAVNIIGTKNLVDLSILYQVQKFVFVSTDKAVNPTSVLGITKKIAEEYVKLKLNNCNTTQWAVVRFGNVWNSNGSVLPIWEEQLRKDTAIEVRNPEVSRYFISASKVAHLLLEIGAFHQLDQKYLLSMGKPIFIKELAKQFISSKQYQYINRICISFSSLMEGEKLHELLIADDEELKDSNHPEVKIINSRSTETLCSESEFNIMLNSYETMNPIVLKQYLFSLLKK